MQFLLLSTLIALLAYFGWRFSRASASRPPTRVIGPDDDPEFLRRLGS